MNFQGHVNIKSHILNVVLICWYGIDVLEFHVG